MKNTFFIFFNLFMLVLFSSCKSGRQHNRAEFTSDTTRFYPVNEYLSQQISHVDSGGYIIYKTTVENGKKDSSLSDNRQFDQLAEEFLQFNISDSRIHKYYKENVFLDETTHSYTFSYTTQNSSLPLKSVDVLLDVANQQVKWVFMDIIKDENGKTVTEKAGWKNNELFFVNRATDTDTGTATQQNIIVWHNQP